MRKLLSFRNMRLRLLHVNRTYRFIETVSAISVRRTGGLSVRKQDG